MAPYNNVAVTTQLLEPAIITPASQKDADSQIIQRTTVKKDDEACSTSKDATINENSEKTEKELVPKIKGYKGIFGEYQTELVWHNIIPLTILNAATVMGVFFFPYLQAWKSVVWGFVVGVAAGFGVTGGVHRYYCHRSFKASIPVQILFMILYSAAGHNPIFEWVRDHRVHHKYSETDADPHNSNRGLFFSHIGWLFLKKHPEVLRKGKQVDMSDILNDPIAQFHDKHFILLRVFLCFLLPTMVPVYFWNETWANAFMTQCLARYCFVLHITWSVNSFAHMYGSKPYDATINPRENSLVAFVAMGEGWHNFHHTFPWDYRASEHGSLNGTLHTLNLFKKWGHVYDTKEASPELIKKVMDNRGEIAMEGKGHCHPPMVEYQDDQGY